MKLALLWTESVDRSSLLLISSTIETLVDFVEVSGKAFPNSGCSVVGSLLNLVADDEYREALLLSLGSLM